MPRPLKVLQVIYRADRAGAETWLVHVLRRVNREDTAIDFLVHDPTPGSYDSEIHRLGSRIFICDGHRNPWRQFCLLRGVLRQYGPYDVVHSHVDYFGGVIMLLARLLGVHARVANCHIDASQARQNTAFARRLYVKVMKLLVHQFATDGLATSGAAAETLFGPEWHSDSRWRVHPACVDLRGFASLVDRQAVRAEFGIPPDAMVFGHVGRFVEQKNHDFLLRVAEILTHRSDRARFVLVGGGTGERQIEEAVRERGLWDRFVILSPRDDIPRLMLGAFDAFLFPSRYEGLGLALVEAQAAGLLCFASTAVPPEAVVIPSLVHQIPLSAGPEFWADTILQQMDVPHPVTQEDALRRVGERFDIGRSASQLVEFYQTVIA